AMAAAEHVVGVENVKTAAADLDRAGKATIPDPKRPAAIIFPASSNEVAEIVKICAQHRLALWPCSKGKNWGYGSATACAEASVILNLERMNRVIEINEQLAYAVI